ncbi:MAG: prepilin peptidase [Eubacteriales bacterium]|nr:prepilin peptidase [Eubacteriales bacterium]
MERWIVTGLLAAASWADLKWRAVPSWMIVTAGSGGFLYALFERREKWYWIFWSASSAAILIVCRATRQAIGYGDGMMWSIMTLYLGIWKNIRVWMNAFVFAFFFSAAVLITGKRNRKTEFPFLPFLTAAYLLELFKGG